MVSGEPRRITVPNFVKIGLSVAEILWFFVLNFWNREILLAIGMERIKTHQHAKFCQNRSVNCEDIKIFLDFSRWRPLQSWIVEFTKFYWLPESEGPRRITVPNFVKIGRSVVAILWFFDLSRWPLPPSCIFEIAKFYWSLEGGDAPSCHISSKSVNQLRRYYNLSIFQDGGHPPSWNLFWAYLDHPQWVLRGLYHCAKFGYDRCSSFYNMNISIFGTFGWKMPVHTPPPKKKNWGFGAVWSPKWAAISAKAKKGTPLCESVSFERLSVKIWWAVWPVGELHKKRCINKNEIWLIFHLFAPKPRIDGFPPNFAQL